MLSMGSAGETSGFDRSNRENAVECSGHRAALDLLDIPVVGEPGPAEYGLDARRPDVARLHRLDAPEREHVGEVDEPELVLVHLEPRVRVLAADVVHRLGEPLNDAGQLALATWNQSPRSAHAVPPLSQPALGGSASPSPDYVFGLGPVDRLEGFIEPA